MKMTYQYGVDSEKIVIDDYISRGFEILEHRYKTKYGEIDVVAKSHNTLVFIEVKARTNPTHEEFVTRKQVKRCCDAGLDFLANHEECYNMDIRFDLAVVVNGSIYQILENAWSCE